ncbi:MAG: hypothetical protein LBL35_08315 [Clostridiales bacterium]|jgi:hypothetical protein|nr:hypothetical protein [Clostridiales bacterium]
MKEFIIEAKVENLDAVQDFIAWELEVADCHLKLQAQNRSCCGRNLC